MTIRWILSAASVAMTFCATELAAQEESICELRDTNGAISIALCSSGADQQQLSDAGAQICGEMLPCGVWFWDDQTKMPDQAPDNHDGLTQDQITSALAVWVAEKNALIEVFKKR